MPRNTSHRSKAITSRGNVRLRTTHAGTDAFIVPVTQSVEVFDQTVIDAVWSGGNIISGGVTLGSFADDMRPVAIVEVLPDLPNDLFPLMSYVVLVSSERLYKNINNVWELGVNGADIVANSITAGQIEAGSISASEIEVGSITNELLAGPMPGGQNVVLNSGFELASFVAASSTKVWDVTADFTASDVRTPTNLTQADTLTMTASTY